MKYANSEKLQVGWLIKSLGVFIVVAAFFLGYQGLYNTYFRERYRLDTNSWVTNSELIVDMSMKPCRKFLINLDNNSLQEVGHCTIPFQNYSKETLLSPNGDRIVEHTRNIKYPTVGDVSGEHLTIFDVSSGHEIYNAQPFDFLRARKIDFFIVIVTIGFLEKATIVSMFMILILKLSSILKLTSINTGSYSIIIWLFICLFFCYGCGFMFYVTRYSGF